MTYDADTTKRYPRTIIEAFKGPDYGNAVVHYPRERTHWLWRLALCASAVLLVGMTCT